MKGYVGWILLAVCLVFTYQGWQTRSGIAETEGRARGVVCDVAQDCVLGSEQPRALMADFMARRYEFKTSIGPVTVTCAREYVVIGNFKCTPSVGSMGSR
ncbi:MAG: hypothetical protein JKY37_10820 [Nannocystaceae bacterium]|nr:hypothetical protein [Nannocystaceae bacterium]